MTLMLLFAALSGLGSVLITVLCPALSLWWCLPLWLGLYVALGIIYILTLIVTLLLSPRRNASPRGRQIIHTLIQQTIDWVVRLLGYRIRLQGTEKLPHTPFLWVSNHRSAFDPLCTIAAVEKDVVFIAKPGVFKIPVIGALMRRVGFMPIDRENARNAVTTIKQAAACIRERHRCVGIYPEGTRSKDGTLLPFHAGSFKIAVLAQCPVVVASVRYEKRPLWGKRVHLHILDVIDTDYVTANNTAVIADRAKNAIAQDIK